MLSKFNIAVQRIFKGNSGEGSEWKEESCRESFHLLKKYINNHVQNAGRNTDGKARK